MNNRVFKHLRGHRSKAALAALALAFAFGSPAEAQCPPSGSCPNLTIPKNLNAEYQQVGEASRINGQGPRMMNKVERVVLYDAIPNNNHLEGKNAIRRMLSTLAVRYGFELVINDNNNQIGWLTADILNGTTIVLFSQGDKDVLGNSATTPSTVAMENYIYRQGGSMMMLHAASAFITCPGTGTSGGGQNIHEASCRFLARATVRQYYHHQNAGTPMRVYADSTLPGEFPPYGSMGAPNNLGPVPRQATYPHGRVNPETKNIFDNSIPFNWPLPPNSPSDPRTYVWDNWADEWYNYASNPRNVDTTMIRNVTNFSPAEQHIEGKVNILLALDELSRNIGSQRMGNHPMSWTRRMGKGLAAYVNIGHNNAPFGARTGGGRSGVDSVAYKYYWNLMRYLARDYEGCTDSTYAEYNPHASVKHITGYEDTAKPAIAAILPPKTEPCVNKSTAIMAGQKGPGAHGITARSGAISIATPDAGLYRVLVSDMRGRVIYSKAISGGFGKTVEVSELAKGNYIVRVKAPQAKGFQSARVIL